MEVVRQGNGIHINILSSGKQICIYSYKLFLKDFFFFANPYCGAKIANLPCFSNQISKY